MATRQPLSATYKSPTSTHAFSSDLPALPSKPEDLSVQAKTEYLSALRASVAKTQNEVNVYLTGKMEEDKAAAEAGTEGKKKLSKREEEKEEEMYGEEDPEQEG